MDRIIPHANRSSKKVFIRFHYLDLIPYSVAALLLSASVYILLAVIRFVNQLQTANN